LGPCLAEGFFAPSKHTCTRGQASQDESRHQDEYNHKIHAWHDMQFSNYNWMSLILLPDIFGQVCGFSLGELFPKVYFFWHLGLLILIGHFTISNFSYILLCARGVEILGVYDLFHGVGGDGCFVFFSGDLIRTWLKINGVLKKYFLIENLDIFKHIFQNCSPSPNETHIFVNGSLGLVSGFNIFPFLNA
ncbi:hypothetical protein ACJX0J_017307, partial [Zea mays]